MRDVMTCNVWTVTLDASLAEVVHLMERHRIRFQSSKLTIVGIVTRANLFHCYGLVLDGAPSVATSRMEGTRPSDPL